MEAWCQMQSLKTKQKKPKDVLSNQSVLKGNGFVFPAYLMQKLSLQ